MNDETKRRLAKRAGAKLTQRRVEQERLRPEKILFPQQVAFVNDRRRKVAASCSRRGGKSFAIAYVLFLAAWENPGSTPLYVTKAKEVAKNIMWPAFRKCAEAVGILDKIEFLSAHGTVKLPNGSRILLMGAGTKREMDKLRGPSYPVVVIDEAQDFGEDLAYLLDEVVEPATSDFLKDVEATELDGYAGKIYLTGTPNAACMGPFHDAVHNIKPMQGWAVHKWTVLDNPHHPMTERGLEVMLRDKGWKADDPKFLREWRGVWLRDGNSMVFPTFDTTRNMCDALPELRPDEEWTYVLGVDVGYNDPAAFVVLAYNEHEPNLYVVHAEEETELIPSDLAKKVTELHNQYSFSAIVVDSGGMGKGYIEEMAQKYALPVLPAEKQKRLAYIELLNGDFQSGAVKLLRGACAKLGDDLQLMQWDNDKKARGKWVFDRTSDENDHQVDGLLYGWRYCYHQFTEARRPLAPAKGTPEAEELKYEEYWEKKRKLKFKELRKLSIRADDIDTPLDPDFYS